MVCEVIVDVSNKNVDQTYDYLVPEVLKNLVAPGTRVRVGFGPREITGIVIRLKEESDFADLKSIKGLCDTYPLLNAELVELGLMMHHRYYTKTIDCLNLMIPSALKFKYSRIAKIIDAHNLKPELLAQAKKGVIVLNDNNMHHWAYLKELALEGKVELSYKLSNNDSIKVEYSYLYLKDVEIRKGKSLDLLNYLKELKEAISEKVIIEAGFTKANLKTLVEKGAIQKVEIVNYRRPQVINVADKVVTLNENQQEVIDKIDLLANKTYLLHGVTGSGKTEVYLELIKQVLQCGKTAIVLVPEISLTPQLAARFKARFGDNLAIMHSHLSQGEKFDEWRKLKEGQAKIVLGARSAIFAPLENVGIIIVDEAHEASYIQQNMPTYSAIEIASWRSKFHNCSLVLGSATPLIKDYYEAICGKYILLELPTRANASELPETKIIDMREELRCGNKLMLSRELQKAITDKLNKHEQIIIFLNRRGFSTSVMCRSCGEVIKCPNCDLPLTYHSFNDSLKCHHCNFVMNSPNICPTCHSSKIRYVGLGTEKIEQTLAVLYPEAKTIRMDRDTTQRKEAYNEFYEIFKNGQADILIGTQMVSKGLDFPNVTLVGVINADIGFFYPRYDTLEVGFAILEQVAGRSGRFKKGEVIIQTYKPENEALKYAATHNYRGFYESEIKRRKRMNNPPFSHLKQISFRSLAKDKAYAEANKLVEFLDFDGTLGPSEALIFKHNNYYTYDVHLKFQDETILNKLYDYYENYNNEEVIIKICDI